MESSNQEGSVVSNPQSSLLTSNIVRSSVRSAKRDSKYRKLNVGLVGNAAVGKTSLIRKFALGDQDDNRGTVTTIGVERTPLQVMIHDEAIDVVMWDPAGQERYQQITKNYFNQVDAIVLVFDMTQADTFEGVLRWFK